MKYSEIVELLEKGFSPDQIMQLSAAPEPQPEPIAEEAPAPVQLDPPETPPAVIRERVVEEQPEPAWAKALNERIGQLTTAIHAQAIKQDIGEPRKETPEDVMMGILGGNKNAS